MKTKVTETLKQMVSDCKDFYTPDDQPMEYLHPFQERESRREWKMHRQTDPVFFDIICIIVTLYMILKLSTGITVFELMDYFLSRVETQGLYWGYLLFFTIILFLGLPALYRYALHPKLPKWARYAIMVPCYIMTVTVIVLNVKSSMM